MLQNNAGQVTQVPAWRCFVDTRNNQLDALGREKAACRRWGDEEVEEDLPGVVVSAPRATEKTALPSETASFETFFTEWLLRFRAQRRQERRAEEKALAAKRLAKFEALPIWATALARVAQELFYFGSSSIGSSYKTVQYLIKTGRYPLWSKVEVAETLTAAFKEIRLAKLEASYSGPNFGEPSEIFSQSTPAQAA